MTPTYEHDDYGYFLTSHVPIYDSHGAYSGFVGVDFDLAYYLAEEARFRKIEIGSLAAALMVALAIGFLVALYYGDLQQRVRQLYYGATRDDLTGLLNRRGAGDAVNKALARNVASSAMLLVDIDHLKMTIAMRGHRAADAVVACTAEAVRQSVHDGDICARLGESEFMVFSADCGMDCAKEMAERILDRVHQQKVPLAGVHPTVSIGIASHGADTDFSRMYHDADEALYQARLEGKSCIGVIAPCAPAATRERGDVTPEPPAAARSNVTT